MTGPPYVEPPAALLYGGRSIDRDTKFLKGNNPNSQFFCMKSYRAVLHFFFPRSLVTHGFNLRTCGSHPGFRCGSARRVHQASNRYEWRAVSWSGKRNGKSVSAYRVPGNRLPDSRVSCPFNELETRARFSFAQGTTSILIISLSVVHTNSLGAPPNPPLATRMEAAFPSANGFLPPLAFFARVGGSTSHKIDAQLGSGTGRRHQSRKKGRDYAGQGRSRGVSFLFSDSRPVASPTDGLSKRRDRVIEVILAVCLRLKRDLHSK